MRPSTQITAAATILLATVGAHADPFADVEKRLNALTYVGCYSSSTGLTFNNTWGFQTQGYCQPYCANATEAVLGLTKKTDCWCGNERPPADTLVADSKCSAGCAGFGQASCGSSDGKYFTVWLSGTLDAADVTNATDSSSDTSSAPSTTSTTASKSTSAAPSVITEEGSVITITAPAQAASVSAAADADAKDKKSKANTTGIIAGVVVGIVLIGAIAGGAFFFLRHRRRKAIEEEYQRNASINNFVSNGKPPGSSAGYSNVTDTRLDHSALQRRMSDGSIADNEDYSRKILRVTNA